MSITIQSPIFDPSGSIRLPRAKLDGTTRTKNLKRRVTRRGTLNGSSHINDLGFTDSDRTITVVLKNPTQQETDSVTYLIRSYSTLVLTSENEMFSGVIETINPTGSELRIVYLVQERLAVG